MKKVGFFLVANLIFFPLSTNAGQPEKESCEQVSNSQQVFECSKVEKEKADRLLNSAYGALKIRIAKQYKSDIGLKDEYIKKAKESQRLWIKLRDADCALEVFEIEVGMQAYETALNNCVTRHSIERAVYLEKISPEIQFQDNLGRSRKLH